MIFYHMKKDTLFSVKVDNLTITSETLFTVENTVIYFLLTGISLENFKSF